MGLCGFSYTTHLTEGESSVGGWLVPYAVTFVAERHVSRRCMRTKVACLSRSLDPGALRAGVTGSVPLFTYNTSGLTPDGVIGRKSTL